jgi:hypothetical protein
MNFAGPIGAIVFIVVIWLVSLGLSKFIKAPVYIIALGIFSILILGGLLFIGTMV